MGLTHPAIVLVVAWVLWLGADRLFVRSTQTHIALNLGLLVASIALTAYVVIVVWYALQPAFFDAAEPTITAVSAVFSWGKPIYPALDAPERYAHIYGPDLFIVHAAAMRLFGTRVLVSKGVGAMSALAGLLLTYGAFARRVSRRVALITLGVCALVYLQFGNTTFWNRPEPLLILCSALALYGVGSRSRLISIVLIGLALAVSWNLKFSGPLYILPPFSVLITRSRWRDALAVVAIAIPLAGAPFLIPTASFVHYVQYIELSARNGVMAARLRQNLEWAVVLMAPLVVGIFRADRGDARRRIDPFIATLAASIVVLVIIAAKPGAGPYHLLPAVSAIAYAMLSLPPRAWDTAGARAIIAALVTTASVFAVPRQANLIRTVRGRDIAPAAADVRGFMDAHPSDSVSVGYAGTSRLADARLETVFRTHDYWLDAPAIQEHRLAGLDVPESTIHALADCRTRYWLIPIGGDPFVVPSAYWPDAGPARVFSKRFRDAFQRSYRRVAETPYFTVWECRRTESAGAERNAFPDARSATER